MMDQKHTIETKQVTDLFNRQLTNWPLLKENYLAFEKIQVKELVAGGVNIHVQFNPCRIVSSAAKVDSKSIQERKCFLCLDHLPPEQEYLPFGKDYLILCNPFPIFPQHFTVPTRRHTNQSIIGRLEDMMDLSLALHTFTVFYNGPGSGASAPDHMHFQVVTRSVMPIDHLNTSHTKLIYKGKNAELHLLTHYLRNGFVLLSTNKAEAQSLFRQICRSLDTPAGETEPMMNIFCNYQDNRWMIKVIPRKKHRPSYYFAEGKDKIITSPGAADIGGLFITSREEDFIKITPAILQDIYEQICFTNDEIASFLS